MRTKKYLVAYCSLAGDKYKVGVVKEENTKLLADHNKLSKGWPIWNRSW